DARPRPARDRRARRAGEPHVDGVQHPRAAPPAVAVRRGPQGHRRARVARRDAAARVERHRRPDEPAARQAAQLGDPDRHGPGRRVQAGGGMNRRLERVNVASLRVALISTGLVAVVYAVVAMVVVVFVTNNLTAQVDNRLAAQLAHYQQQPAVRLPFASVNDSGQGDFGAPLLIWAVDPAGFQPTQTNIVPPVDLPPQDATVTTPVTTS